MGGLGWLLALARSQRPTLSACFLGGARASAGRALSFLCQVDCFDPSLINARLLKEFTIVPNFLLFGLIL